MLHCADCGKVINLKELNNYFFENEEDQIIIKCNNCMDSKKEIEISKKNNALKSKYAISYTCLAFAFIFLFSFFMITNPFFVLIAILLAIFSISFNFLKKI